MILLPVVAVVSVAALVASMYYVYSPKAVTEQAINITRRNHYKALQDSIGVRCEIPQLDPFAKEITKYDVELPAILCSGQDWVKCYHSKCRVVDAIKALVEDITCTFKDILYVSDLKYSMGPGTQIPGDDYYELTKSDHVFVECYGTWKEKHWYTLKSTSWLGNVAGLRRVSVPPAPGGRERAYNVVILAFDSASRNGFIRRMPKSWKMLHDIGATVMEGYNVVGESTEHTVYPILTGKAVLELPNRKGAPNSKTFDNEYFIFSKLKRDGYRTAYFEDSPEIGTFTYRYNGFSRQPTDHYLRPFMMAEWYRVAPILYWMGQKKLTFCLGDTPQFKMMLNMTEQFMELDGKRFIFTFIADITHDNFNQISNADEDTAVLLRRLAAKAEDTLIVVMGDHGPRYSKGRNTPQGRLEHQLPLLALRLPDRLTRARPSAARALLANARALSTPHDLHATLLDALDWRQHANTYTVPGAGYARGLSLLEPIPRNRSCGEAGIEPHLCACLAWQNVSATDPMYQRTALALIDYINSLLHDFGALCAPRTLNSTTWVLQQPDDLPAHSGALESKNYLVKICADPGGALFEAKVTYLAKQNKFAVNATDIARTNAYGHEPDCIARSHPHLNPFCYCRPADTQAHNNTADNEQPTFENVSNTITL